MGEVAAKIKLMPKSMDVDLNKLKEDVTKVIPEGAKLHGFAEEPIAFGLKALIVVVLVGDLEGGTEKVEEALSTVEGVESVSVVELGRT
ncbi:MAG: elongation factor 1-beta [Candidatus Methanoperedens sp.]|jgi:elongation factor 1-beta|nr:elongation factor 1-beta [Candidatus Methanoperedens sp.]PKL52770.1 MAG: elongation factor 1-beta [Candidatus Methanoperedenaceae archaeon HGW-Methanoperedenaceae-1]